MRWIIKQIVNSKLIFKKYSILALLPLFFACVEEYVPQTSVFEDVLIVETMLTDEFKHHKVTLTRSYTFEEEGPQYETNALVWIVDSQNHNFVFSETSDGVYISDQQFMAQPNVSYTLHIKTNDGKEYQSEEETLISASPISNLYAELATQNNETGVQVFIDNDNLVNNDNFFMYEFEETYKIVTPIDIQLDFETANEGQEYLSAWGQWAKSFDILTSPHTSQTSICYQTDYQKEMLLANTDNLNTKIKKFPIRFISNNSYLLRERYSILVKQLVLSEEAFFYYSALNKMQINGNVFIENQPGYVKSNINSLQDENEKVVGYFSVSQMTSKRIYFNYFEFGFEKPPYPFFVLNSPLDYRDATWKDRDQDDRELIYEYINNVNSEYTIYNIEFSFNIPIYYYTYDYTCDCTTFSSNIIPEFWEE